MTQEEGIKAITQLAQSDPNQYDISKLNNAIKMITETKDVDALFILGRPQAAIVRDNLYKLEQDELDAMKLAIENCGFEVKEVKQLEPENARDDYAFVLNDEEKKLVWISKMKPLFDSNDYHLLAVGFSFPATSYSTMDELIADTIRKLKE